MLRILVGKAKSGKTYTLYDEIKQAIESKNAHDTLLIVPEQYTLEAERQLINHLGHAGILGADIISFKRLAYHVFAEVGGIEGEGLNELGQLMLLKHLFDQHQKELTIYKKAYEKSGFITKFKDVIKELKQNRVTPEAFGQMLKDKDLPRVLEEKCHDIELIYNAYEYEKANSYFDDEDFYEALIVALEDYNGLSQKNIWIDGFDSFSGQEYKIIEKLARTCKNVTISLTTDGDYQEGVFNHTNKGLGKLMSFDGVETKVMKLNRQYLDPSLAHMSDYLQHYPYKVYKDDTLVSLYGAQNIETEVEYIAMDIVNKMKTGQYTYRDFAVVTNDLDHYRMTVKRLMTLYDLPYFIDEKMTMTTNPLVHHIRLIGDLLVNGLESETVIALLKDGFYPFSMSQLATFEQLVIEHGIRKDKFLQPFDQVLGHLKTDQEADKIQAIAETLELCEKIRLTFVDSVQPLLAYMKSKAVAVDAFAKSLYDAFVAFDIPDKVSHYVMTFMDEGDFDEAQLFSQIWNELLGIMDQVVEVMKGQEISVEMFFDLLEIGVGASEIGLLPLVENHILVGSIERSKSHEIKVLYVMGVNDGILPEAGADHQLILDIEKDLIEEDWLANREMFVNKEMFNIYEVVSRPSQALILTYAFSNSEGGALRPSFLIQKTKQIFDKVTHDIESTSHFKDSKYIVHPQAAYRHLAQQLRLHLDGFEIDPIWIDLMGWYRKQQPETAERLMKAAMHHNQVDNIQKHLTRKLYDMPLKTSVSRLEQFVQCPFKHFVEFGLKPNRIKTYAIDYPDVGILFHKSLELFGRALHDKNQKWEDLSIEECQKMMAEIIDQMVTAEIYQSKFQYLYLIRKLKRVSQRAITILTEQLQQGEFVPAAFELAFTDGNSGVPPILIELSNGEKLMIRGVVDRVDLMSKEDKTYLKIIDYKSGKKELTFSDIYNGLQMQLLVYMDACLREPGYFRKEALYPAGIFYYKIDDPLIDTTEMVIDVIEAEITKALRLDGIALDDAKVLSAIDSQLFENAKSNVIPVALKKDGDFTKDSKVLDENAFKALMRHVDSKIKSIGYDISEGCIKIEPTKSGTYVSCDYCEFKGICQFDQQFKDNRYKQLTTLSRDEVLEKIGGGQTHATMDT